MPQYQLRACGNGDGEPLTTLTADDDLEAVELVRLQLEPCDVELRRGESKVAIVRKDGAAIFVAD